MKEFTRVCRKGGDQGDRGRDFPDGRVLSQEGNKGFRNPKALSLDGEIGTSGNKVEGGPERAEGCLVDRLDGRDGGDSNSKGKEIQEGEGLMPEKITAPMGQEHAQRGKPVQVQLVEWIRPSTKAMRRSAEAATSGLWVTRTTVVFCWRASRVISSMTALLEEESRFPVGSSARSTEG